MTRKRVIVVAAGVFGLAVIGGLSGLYLLARPTPFTEAHLPERNGYDDLLEAAKSLAGPVPDVQDASVEKLRLFVERNPDALPKAREGLSKECRVPVYASPQYVNAAMNRSQALRKLGYLFIAKGRIAENDGDVVAAAECYRDGIRLGTQIAHGGITLDILTGLACEGMGARRLEPLLPELPGEVSQELAETLAEIDAGREPWENVSRREWALFRNTSPAMVRISVSLSSGIRQMAEKSYEQAEESRKKAQARLRLLAVRLALRAYHLDHGEYPDSLSELAPGYLDAIPADPFGDGALSYQRTGGDYEIRSSGYTEETEPAAK